MNNQYTILVRREGVKYVAVCLELNIARQGASLEEAQENVIEAIRLWLTDGAEDDSADGPPSASNLMLEFMLAQTQTDDLAERFSTN